MAGPTSSTRRSMFRLLAGAACALSLAACDVPSGAVNQGTSGGSVQVALLVPAGSSDGNVAFIAQSLTNAAKLAVSELDGVTVDLRVYDTAGNSSQAASVAAQAVNEGAKVIVGPLYGQSANAVGVALAGTGVNVLSFSNNPAVAGGNVFILGNTFDNTARRLVSYSQRQGKSKIMVVSGQSAAENTGRDAIVRAANSLGAQIVDTSSFELSQSGITSAAPGIASRAAATGAQSIFFTSGTEAALPFLTAQLPDNGLSPATAQFIGLTRWDIPSSALALPGVQGGWFAMPDPQAAQTFAARYGAAFGSPPHAIAGLAYDGIAAVGALMKSGGDLSASALTNSSGFAGSGGTFRLTTDGANQRALAIAQIQSGTVRIVDSAPSRLGSAGF